MSDRGPALRLERVIVDYGRLTAVVCVQPGFPHLTDAPTAQRLLEARPTLACHACANGAGATFGAVVGHTSLAHVLEHVIIDEQVRLTRAAHDAAPPAPACALSVPSPSGDRRLSATGSTSRALAEGTFVGTTEWLDEAAGRARIEVNFADDLVALRALNRALAFVNDIMLR